MKLPFFSKPDPKNPSVHYEFLIEGQPRHADEFIGREDELLDYYLGLDELSCCQILGGYVIAANGTPVMEETDEVSMSESWLLAIIELQRGVKVEAQVWAWEESHMTLWRKGQILELEDIHHSGQVICPRTQFQFVDFVRAMLEASRPVALVASQLHEAMNIRERGGTCSDSLKEKFLTLRAEIKVNWSSWVAECESLIETA